MAVLTTSCKGTLTGSIWNLLQEVAPMIMKTVMAVHLVGSKELFFRPSRYLYDTLLARITVWHDLHI